MSRCSCNICNRTFSSKNKAQKHLYFAHNVRSRGRSMVSERIAGSSSAPERCEGPSRC